MVVGDQLSVPSTMESLCGEEKDDTACCVCSDGNFEENNLIVFCDGCNIAVHQLCYGITEVPDGPYLCSHCMSMEPAAQVRHCRRCFCRYGRGHIFAGGAVAELSE